MERKVQVFYVSLSLVAELSRLWLWLGLAWLSVMIWPADRLAAISFGPKLRSAQLSYRRWCRLARAASFGSVLDSVERSERSLTLVCADLFP